VTIVVSKDFPLVAAYSHIAQGYHTSLNNEQSHFHLRPSLHAVGDVLLSILIRSHHNQLQAPAVAVRDTNAIALDGDEN
jgi:hypothetical protein